MSSERADLRALAHPTRVQIIDLLQRHPSLTATECATLLHLTPKTCSYHLQTLAASGLVSEIPVNGRNRPWQLTPKANASDHLDGADSRGHASVRRGRRAEDVRVRRDESLLADAAAAVAEAASDERWVHAVAVHTHPATMTPAEVAAWCEEVERLTRRHVRRASSVDDPAGAAARTAVHLTFFGFPVPPT